VNKLPIWRAIVMVVALAFGLLYTLPNFFGEAPAVQVSSAKSTVKVDQETADKLGLNRLGKSRKFMEVA